MDLEGYIGSGLRRGKGMELGVGKELKPNFSIRCAYIVLCTVTSCSYSTRTFGTLFRRLAR